MGRGEAWDVVEKAGLDSIPVLRRALLDELVRAAGDPLPTAAFAERLDYPTGTVRRGLEDLTAHQFACRVSRGSGGGKGGGGSADTWAATELTLDLERGIRGFPDLSSNAYSVLEEDTSSDFSGTPSRSELE